MYNFPYNGNLVLWGKIGKVGKVGNIIGKVNKIW